MVLSGALVGLFAGTAGRMHLMSTTGPRSIIFMARKRNRHSVPRRKRMKRPGRLSSAQATGWVAEYKGRNIIAGYSKWFAVDLLCALIELRLLGVKIDQGREEQIKASIKARAAQRDRRKKLREQAQIGEVHAVPDDFFFISDWAGDYLPDWVCADELQEGPRWYEEDVWCDEEEEFIEPSVSVTTVELWNLGKADVTREETGKSTLSATVVGVQGSEERSAE